MGAAALLEAVHDAAQEESNKELALAAHGLRQEHEDPNIDIWVAVLAQGQSLQERPLKKQYAYGGQQESQ